MKKTINIYHLLSNKKVKIDIGSWVPNNIVYDFAYPLLINTDSDKNILKFLKQSTSLVVKITNRKPENWRVYYSGTIENEFGVKKEFKDIDNGFVVNIG